METVSFSTIAPGEHAPIKDVGVGMEWHVRVYTWMGSLFPLFISFFLQPSPKALPQVISTSCQVCQRLLCVQVLGEKREKGGMCYRDTWERHLLSGRILTVRMCCPFKHQLSPGKRKGKKKLEKVRDPNKDASHRINSAWLYSLRHKNTAGGHNQIAVWWEWDAERRLTVSEELKQASVKLHWHKLERNTRGLNTQHGEINKEQVKVTSVGQSEQREANKNVGRKKKCKVRQHMWAQKP